MDLFDDSVLNIDHIEIEIASCFMFVFLYLVMNSQDEWKVV